MKPKLLLAFSIALIAACTTAPPYVPETKFILSCPKNSVNGKKVPILVIAKGESSDPLRSVVLTIETNPAPHRDGMTALIQGPYPVSVIKINVRLAGEGNARLRAKGIFESGQSEVADCDVRYTDGVIFDDVATLVDPDKLAPTSPVGKQWLQVKRPGTSNTVSIGSLLVHPMRTGTTNALLSDVSVVYRDTEIAKLTLSDAISSNPFLGISLMDGQVGRARVTWREANGKVYEMEQ